MAGVLDITQDMAANMSAPQHPFYPIRAAIPGYVANTIPTPALLALFASATLAILSQTYLLIRGTRPSLPRRDVAIAMWFVLCGFIHLFFEGYFALNFYRVGGRTDVFGQLWKEYSLSDSRYMTRDSFVVCMEAITAVFWGPGSFLCAYFIVTGHPLRYPLQSIVSLGQLYGDVLYYATCSFDGLVAKLVYCRPEMVYFWAYYICMNAFWIVIPLTLVIQSAKATAATFAKLGALEEIAGAEKKDS